MDILLFLYAIMWTFGLSLIGSSIFSVLGIRNIAGMQRFALSYWLGYTLFGLGFFVISILGIMSATTTIALFVLAFPTLILRRKRKKVYPYFAKQEVLMMGLFALATLFNLPSALAPVSDASALTSSFVMAKEWASLGAIPFQPIAVEFIAPHLVTAHFAASYLIGGEAFMLLNIYFAGIMAALSAYALARRRLRTTPSWVFALAIYTIPALSFISGTGYPHVVLMGLMTSAALALIYYARSERLSWLFILILLTSGALSASYLGLFIALSIFASLLFVVKVMGWKKIVSHLLVFILLTALLGSYWYVWIHIQTGSAFFPYFVPTGSNLWSTAQMAYFHEVFIASHQWMEVGFWHWIWSFPYDIAVGTGSSYALGALFALAVLPALMMFLKRFPFMTWELHVGAQELYMFLFVMYYSLWFFFGFSQDTIELLPAFPLLVLPAFVWLLGVTARLKLMQVRLIYVGVACLLVFQLSTTVKANTSALAVWSKYQTREDYQQNTVPTYSFAQYLNINLPTSSKVMHHIKGLSYNLNMEELYTPLAIQQVIPLATGSMTQNLNAIWYEGVTHWVFERNPMDSVNDTIDNGHALARQLVSYGCMSQIGKLEGMAPKKAEKEIEADLQKMDFTVTPIRLDKSVLPSSFEAVTYYVYQFIPYCAGA